MKLNDKLLHFIISGVLTVLLSFVFGYMLGVCFTLCIGVIKELYDYFVKDNFSIADLKADGAGIVVGLAIFSIIKSLI